MSEASQFFDGTGGVQESLRRITQRLDELGIPYAIVGGMALFLHGYRRFTEDVDLLVTSEDLPRIHAELRGRGYLPPFEKSKQLRDTETKVRIEFLTSGGYPGDGKPKPVAFPDPRNASIEINGLKVLQLERLIELKLASGMSAPHRLRDLADVQELIRGADLPRETVERLDPSVRDKFFELWNAANQPPSGPDVDAFDG
ncbi:MAG: nucleotidyltransferase family protein [Planctomycetaceae bacterium]